ncbi:ubiquinone biosynthesis protein coq4 mitochondrial [Stylonychia lemnae]|uniref:Ubiquinone biosynthesis protein coq4 mitochondrial n=1 Tax=Stylonychia lemnae TaxID=5949 RepID=A0A077ZYV1_STYLE|nr:ubiquinone biosynthesis protein coq4 mitochondrial [Stylonychia lemnae]|eukprot:CDW74322.1 ubiquinone biosynthesis protein coq4 mitochondrial [Stylonychia lemnae]
MDPEGSLILQEKPRVNNQTWNKAKLLSLPHNTFGYQFAKWMKEKDFQSDERPVAKYVPDLELAYIIQRYREVFYNTSQQAYRFMTLSMFFQIMRLQSLKNWQLSCMR